MKKRIYSRPVSVTLSDDMFKQIYEIAEKQEISMSEVIRCAVEEKLSKNDKARQHHCRNTN
jgi:metal-responsive CopG/Arc/MetJ family transcriptional regulator